MPSIKTRLDYWILVKEEGAYVWYLSKISKQLIKKVRMYTSEEDYPIYVDTMMTDEERATFDIEALWQKRFGEYNHEKINWFKGASKIK
jgi:hypothetical protein